MYVMMPLLMITVRSSAVNWLIDIYRPLVAYSLKWPLGCRGDNLAPRLHMDISTSVGLVT